MNRISLAHYLSAAAKQLNPKAALELLEKQAAKLASEADSQDAVALLVMEAAHYKLVVGDVQGCKAAIKRCEKILEGIAAVAPSINATFYRVSADYYKITQSYPEYYHNALLFLSSVSLADLDKTVKQQRAHDLALSALLGADLYNFGELLTHPILQCLADTPYAWLRTLLLQYNSGDLEGFERLIKTADFMKQVLFN